MTEIAKAYVQIVPTTKDIGSNLRSELGGKLDTAGEEAGSSWASKFASAAKTAIAALGIGKVIGSALNAGAELEQNLGGTEAVFGRFAQNIQDKAKEAYQNMGLSASDYMATANKMGSLFQGSGLEQQRALDLTADAMQRAADVASVMGIDMQTAMDSIAGAAKGNFTMMDNLGVAMNATTLEAYALEKGVNFEWNTASNAEKAELAMQMFFDRTQQYAGNYAREAQDTFSGSLESMKAAWENTLAALSTGEGLGSALSQLGETAHAFFFDNFLPMIGNVVEQLPQVIGDISGLLIKELNHVSEHTDELVQFAVEIVTGISSSLIDNIPLFIEAAIQLAMALAESLLSFDWAGTITDLVDKIFEKFTSLSTDMFGGDQSIITGIITGITSGIGNLLSTAAELVTTIVGGITDNLPQILAVGVQLIGELLIGIMQSVPDILSGIFELITSIANAFFETDWASIGMNIINGIIDGLSQLLPNLIESAKNVAKAAWDTAKNWLGIRSPSKKFAELGMYSAEGFAEGLTDNSNIVARAASGISEVAESELSSDYTLGTASRIGSSSMYGTGTASGNDLVETLGRLGEILTSLEENGIPAYAYMDGKSVSDTVTKYQRRAMRAGALA